MKESTALTKISLIVARELVKAGLITRCPSTNRIVWGNYIRGEAETFVRIALEELNLTPADVPEAVQEAERLKHIRHQWNGVDTSYVCDVIAYHIKSTVGKEIRRLI